MQLGISTDAERRSIIYTLTNQKDLYKPRTHYDQMTLLLQVVDMTCNALKITLLMLWVEATNLKSFLPQVFGVSLYFLVSKCKMWIQRREEKWTFASNFAIYYHLIEVVALGVGNHELHALIWFTQGIVSSNKKKKKNNIRKDFPIYFLPSVLFRRTTMSFEILMIECLEIKIFIKVHLESWCELHDITQSFISLIEGIFLNRRNT